MAVDVTAHSSAQMTADHPLTEAWRGYVLPRSTIRLSNVMMLNGTWRFALDTDDRGLREGWQHGHEYLDHADWPGSIERLLAARAESDSPSSPLDKVIAWYERDFTVSESWRNHPDCLVELTFGACGYETRVWLNGHSLETVEGQLVHLGEFTSFTYELPPELLLSVNRLTVRVADSLDAEIPRGKQESTVYKRGGIWYQASSGPQRDAWLELVHRNRLRSRIDVITSIEDRLAEFILTTHIHDPGDYTLRLIVSSLESDIPIAVEELLLTLEAGEWMQRVVVPLPSAEPWSPANPRLYYLTAQLDDGHRSVSELFSRFGLRKIEARGRRVYLNSEPIYLDGILYQPGGATYQEMRRHLLAMKELGCNLVRVHITGIDPRIYDMADEIGMMLWVEVPSPHVSSERSRVNHRAELDRMLQFTGAHPSIVIWSLYNEDWGAQDIATSPETRSYIAGLFDAMHRDHPAFLVVDNDGWHHVSVGGWVKTDLLTVHLYTPELDRWRMLLDRLEEGDTENVAVLPLVVGDPFLYRGQVPLVVSEWGGFGFSGYGGPEDSVARAEKIRAFKRELRERSIAGDVYTQATSIEDEDNGLIDARTGELLVPAGLLRSERKT
jgi:beta-galactosidase/beta-glucuronidase